MKISVIALFVLMLMWTVPTAQAATIFSDSFNIENGGTGALNYTGFANWTVTGGAVDLIGNGFFDFYPGNGLYVDLDGTLHQAGLLTSTPISLAAGTYTLQFSLGGSQRGDTNTVLVTLGSFYNESFTLASTDPLSLFTRSITVGGPSIAALTFQNGGGDNIGAILDDVRLDSVETVVPESASILMMAFGLGGLGIVGRRALSKRFERT